MIFFKQVLEETDQKDSVENLSYGLPDDIHIFLTSTCVFQAFFYRSESRFPGSDPDFLPIRIRTQEKKSYPDTKHWNFAYHTYVGFSKIKGVTR